MSNIITSSSKKATAILSIAALASILLCVPLLFRLVQELHDGNNGALIALLFLVLPVVLGGAAIYSAILWFKFGESRFELVSATIGHGLAGVVYAPRRSDSTNGFKVVLSCTNHKSSGSSSDHSSETIVWQDTLSLTESLPSSEGHQLALPVLFQIPVHLLPSDSSNQSDRIVWTLDISAELPGIDYSSTFTIPVLRSPEGLAKQKPLDMNAIAAYIQKDSESSFQETEGIEITELPSATHVSFKRCRFVNHIPFQIITVVVWGVALFSSVFFHAPLFVFWLLVAIELASVQGVLDTLTGTAEIIMKEDQLVTSITSLGFHRNRVIDWQDVRNIEVVRAFQRAGHLFVKIRLTKKNGHGISIGRAFKNRKHAEEIVDKLNRFRSKYTSAEMND